MEEVRVDPKYRPQLHRALAPPLGRAIDVPGPTPPRSASALAWKIKTSWIGACLNTPPLPLSFSIFFSFLEQ
jgi:hypothetical protein